MPIAEVINGRKRSDLLRLQKDEEFKKVLNSDPIIQGAFDSKDENPEDLRNELFMTLGSDCVIGGKVVIRPPTIGCVALLDNVDSPFLNGNNEMTVNATRIALHILIFQKEALSGITDINKQLPLVAKETYDKIEGLDIVSVCRGVYAVINRCFHAFRYIREKLPTQGKSRYDSLWLGGVVAQVSRFANLKPMEIIWETPMPLVSYLIVQARKMDGWDVRRDTQAQEAMERLEMLIDKRLAEYEGMKNNG